MKLSIKIALFVMLAATGLVQAQVSKAEKATIKFERKYAQAITDYKLLEIKNQATSQMQQFFMKHEFYKVNVYKRLLKKYAQYKSAQENNEKTVIDEFFETIKMMRPEILGISLYQDFHKEYVLDFQEKGFVNHSRYKNEKQFIFIFSQKTNILADFIAKYKPYLSASLMVQMLELQKQFCCIKESLEKAYGLKFVQKYSKTIRFAYFCATFCYIFANAVLGCAFGILIGLATHPPHCLLCASPFIASSILLIPLSLVVIVYSYKYLKTYIDIRPAYRNWLQFIV